MPPPRAPRTPATTPAREPSASSGAETAAGPADSARETLRPARLAPATCVLRAASPQVTGGRRKPVGPAPAAPGKRKTTTIAPGDRRVHPASPRRRSVSRHLTGSLRPDPRWSSCRSAEYTLRNEPLRSGPGPGPGAGGADVAEGGTCRAAPPPGWPAVPGRLPLPGPLGDVPSCWSSGDRGRRRGGSGDTPAGSPGLEPACRLNRGDLQRRDPGGPRRRGSVPGLPCSVGGTGTGGRARSVALRVRPGTPSG